MLEASENNPSDRQAFEARLDEMVDAVHRYDLAGLGAGADVDEARFEKGAPGRYPADDLSGGSQAEGQGERAGPGDGFPASALGERRRAGLHQLFLGDAGARR
jgi:hypothetical protein